MLKFQNSSLEKLISSFEDYKSLSKKHSQIENKAFANLQNWAVDSHNSAIQDVTGKLQSLYTQLNTEINEEKISNLKGLSQMFKKFKDYDSKIEKFNHNIKILEKNEKKCLNEMKKCPVNKSIRDYEVKYNRARHERENAEIKYFDFTQEIETTKIILFKTHFKRYNEILMRKNEAEKVLFEAMKNLLDNIPDVSNEVVDDISDLNYGNFEQTNQICVQAKKKLNRLSSSAKIETNNNQNSCGNSEEVDTSDSDEVTIRNEVTTKKVLKKSESVYKPKKKQVNKSRISCPPQIKLEQFQKQENKLFPVLDNVILNQGPPPTYSDSESLANELKKKLVMPSAPSYQELIGDNTVISKPIK